MTVTSARILFASDKLNPYAPAIAKGENVCRYAPIVQRSQLVAVVTKQNPLRLTAIKFPKEVDFAVAKGSLEIDTKQFIAAQKHQSQYFSKTILCPSANHEWISLTVKKMIINLTELMSQLRATFGKTELTLSTIVDAIAWTDEEGNIQWSNETFDCLVGRQHFEVLGAKLVDLLPLEQQGQEILLEAHPINLALQHQSNMTGVYEFRQADRRLILEISGNCVQLKKQQTSAVISIRDITECQQKDEPLKQHREHLWKQVEERTNELIATNQKLQKEINERQWVEAALRESEERFRSLVSNIPGAVYRCRCDSDWTMEFIGDAIADISGYPASDFIHNRVRTFSNIIHPEDIANSAAFVLNSVQQRQAFAVEYRIIRPDGSIRWISDKGQGVFAEDGTLKWLDGVIFDITERKQAEQELRKSNRRSTNILESITDACFVLGFDWRFTYINRQAEQLLDRMPEELLGKNIWDEFPQALGSTFYNRYDIAIAQQVPVAFEEFYPPLNTWFEVRTYPSEDGISVYLRDITERKTAEEELRNLGTALENAVEGISRIDDRGRYVAVNKAYASAIGYEPEETIGMEWQRTVHPEDMDKMSASYQQMLQSGKAEAEVRGVRKDGSIFYKQVVMVAAYDQQQRLIGHHCFMKDITERKQHEEALRENEARYRAIVEDQTELICRFLPDGTLTFVNGAYCRYFSKQSEELIGYPFTLFIPKEEQKWVTQQIELLTQEKPVLEYEHQVVMPNGNICWLQWTNRTIFDNQGEFVEFQAVGRDVTQRKQAEEMLSKRERYWAILVAVGRRLLADNSHGNVCKLYKKVLQTLGPVSGASRIYIFENHSDESGRLLMSQRGEWCARGVQPEIDNPTLQNLCYDGFAPRWAKVLAQGKFVAGIVADFPLSERLVLEPQGILSILILPLMVDGKFFGFIGFDNCAEARAWTSSEIDFLSAAATTISLYQERRQAEEALRESEERFRQLAENIDEIFWMTDLAGKVLYISPAYEKIWGRSRESLYQDSNSFLDAIHIEDRDRIIASWEIQLRGEYDVEYRILRPDGSVRWIWDRAFPVRDGFGQVSRIAGIAEDITERKQTEEELLRISAAVERSSDAIAIAGVKDLPIYVNPAFSNLFGYSLEELLAAEEPDILFVNSAVREKVFAVVRSGNSWRGEVEMIARNGSLIPVSLRADGIKDASGQVVGAIAIHTDISDRLRTEQALRESEEKFRNLVEQTNDWVWEIDLHGAFTYVNPKAGEITGYAPEEILGKRTIDFMSPDEAQQFAEVIGFFVSTRQPFTRLEKTLIHKKGHAVILESSGSPVFTAQGMLQGYRGIARDITERKKAESEIHKALEKEKELIELKSRFISMVSHEFRTPLSTILLYAELLEHYSHKSDEAQKGEYFQRIRTAVKNMTQLLENVLIIGKAEAGKIKFNPQVLDLNAFCQNLVNEMQLSAGSEQTIAVVTPSCCAPANLDEKLLWQILTNLLSNALKYSLDGGIVYFSYSCQNGQVVFQVRDEGIGIPAEDQQHLFEPFYRATNVGTIPGTGLGLAIINQCVNLHSGKISVSSKIGEGTTFTVTLPQDVKLKN